MVAWLSDAARMSGAHLMMLIVMGASLIIVASLRHAQRGEAAVEKRDARPSARTRGV